MAGNLNGLFSILIVSSTEQFNTFAKKILPRGCFDTVETARSASAAKRELLNRNYDIVLVNAPLSDELGTDFVKNINDRYDCGIVLSVPQEIYNEVNDHLFSLGIVTIPKPIRDRTLEKSIRFYLSIRQKMSRNEKRLLSLQTKMDELKVISRAKIVLVQKGMTEEAAHEYIIREAMDRGMKKRAVAEEILEDS